MFNLSENEFEDLLKRNPALSVAGHPLFESKNTSRIEENKYRNHPVYIFSDGYVLSTADCAGHKSQVQGVVKRLTEQHGPVAQLFDSAKESKRYLELLLLEKTGEIQDLDRQVVLTIQEKFEHQGEIVRAIRYCADFMYVKDGKTVIEDVKGYDAKKKRWLTTQVFDLKWKLLKAKYPEYTFQLY